MAIRSPDKLKLAEYFVTERGAARSASKIAMIAGGNHTTTNFTRIATTTALAHELAAGPARQTEIGKMFRYRAVSARITITTALAHELAAGPARRPQ